MFAFGLAMTPFNIVVSVFLYGDHMCGHIIDRVGVRPDDDIHEKSIVTDSL